MRDTQPLLIDLLEQPGWVRAYCFYYSALQYAMSLPEPQGQIDECIAFLSKCILPSPVIQLAQEVNGAELAIAHEGYGCSLDINSYICLSAASVSLEYWIQACAREQTPISARPMLTTPQFCRTMCAAR